MSCHTGAGDVDSAGTRPKRLISIDDGDPCPVATLVSTVAGGGYTSLGSSVHESQA